MTHVQVGGYVVFASCSSRLRIRDVLSMSAVHGTVNRSAMLLKSKHYVDKAGGSSIRSSYGVQSVSYHSVHVHRAKEIYL